jgi:hypothetical protein
MLRTKTIKIYTFFKIKNTSYKLLNITWRQQLVKTHSLSYVIP